MISTVKNGTKRKIFEENERFYYRFAKGALLLRGSCGFDSRREYQRKKSEKSDFFSNYQTILSAKMRDFFVVGIKIGIFFDHF